MLFYTRPAIAADKRAVIFLIMLMVILYKKHKLTPCNFYKHKTEQLVAAAISI